MKWHIPFDTLFLYAVLQKQILDHTLISTMNQVARPERFFSSSFDNMPAPARASQFFTPHVALGTLHSP